MLSRQDISEGFREGYKSVLEGGDNHFRMAFKARNAEGFTKQMKEALTAYNNAVGALTREKDPLKKGTIEQTRAAASLANSYLVQDAQSRKKALESGVHAEKRAIEAFEEGHIKSETLHATLALIILLAALFNLEWDIDKRIAITKEALTHAQRIIADLTKMRKKTDLAWGFYYTSIHSANSSSLLETTSRRETAHSDSVRYARRALQLSRKASADLLCIKANLLVLSRLSYTKVPLAVSHSYLHEAYACATRTRDNEAIGDALLAKAISRAWEIESIRDPRRKAEYFKEAKALAEKASERYGRILSLEGISGANTCLAYLHYQFALMQVDLAKRQQLLETAEKMGQKSLNNYRKSGAVSTYGAEDLGPPSLILTRIFHQLALLTESSDRKRELLNESLRHGEEISHLLQVKEPYHSWNRGVALFQSALIKEELSKLGFDPSQRISLMEEAAKNAEEAFRLCEQYYEPSMQIPKHIRISLGVYAGKLCSILDQLYRLTDNVEYQQKLLMFSREAIDFFREGGWPSGAAETHWRLAKTFDQLGKHSDAAKEFSLASEDYELAAQEMPRAQEFFSGFAVYMKAWSEIEKGKHDHGREEYGAAKEAYEKAAALHRSLSRWSYLADNYAAWAEVEHAEELSRKNLAGDAIQAFQKAEALLKESKMTIRSNLARIEEEDERRMASELSRGADLRGEYCKARIKLEEAMQSQDQGEYSAAIDAFGHASESLEKIAGSLDSNSEKREVRLIAVLAKAWQAMTRAESEAVPEYYGQASKLFEEAKSLGQNEIARLLLLGHSHFCKALESGTRFIDTRERSLHSIAVQQLESAADYYLRAGFENSAEHAKATRLLFDAYAYKDDASRERDNQRRLNLYTLAEEHLLNSAEAFVKAGQLRKQTEVLKLLGRVREEQALTRSMTKVLETSGEFSTATAFSTPTPKRETAVGLEGFEHANVQVRITSRQKRVKLGETVDLDLELVNAGKGTAHLVKIEKLLPHGLSLAERPEGTSIKGLDLQMNGRDLASLRTEDLKLVLQTRVQGRFALNPRILYLDEGGQMRSVEPEPVEITVRELGISGWLKGKLPG